MLDLPKCNTMVSSHSIDTNIKINYLFYVEGSPPVVISLFNISLYPQNWGTFKMNLSQCYSRRLAIFHIYSILLFYKELARLVDAVYGILHTVNLGAMVTWKSGVLITHVRLLHVAIQWCTWAYNLLNGVGVGWPLHPNFKGLTLHLVCYSEHIATTILPSSWVHGGSSKRSTSCSDQP